MKFEGEITVLDVKHFAMDNGNCGLSLRVLGDARQDNNNFGIATPFASVADYNEINFLKQFKADQFPLKLNCNISMVTVKDNNKNEKASMQLSNLKFVNFVEFTDKPKK